MSNQIHLSNDPSKKSSNITNDSLKKTNPYIKKMKLKTPYMDEGVIIIMLELLMIRFSSVPTSEFLKFASYLKVELKKIIDELKIDSKVRNSQESKLSDQELWEERIFHSAINEEYQTFMETHITQFKQTPIPKELEQYAIREPSIVDLLKVKNILLFSNCEYQNEATLFRNHYFLKISDNARKIIESYTRNKTQMNVLLMYEMNDILSKSHMMEKNLIENDKEFEKIGNIENLNKEFAMMLKAFGFNWLILSDTEHLTKEIENLYTEKGIAITEVSRKDIDNLCIFFDSDVYTFGTFVTSIPMILTTKLDKVSIYENSEDITATILYKKSKESMATLKVSGITETLTRYFYVEFLRYLMQLDGMKDQSFLPPIRELFGKIIEKLQEKSDSEYLEYINIFITLCQDLLMNENFSNSTNYEIYEKWNQTFEWILDESCFSKTSADKYSKLNN